jgi:type IV pilus assembly protein PilA
MHCNFCGALLQTGDTFCAGCGRAVVPAAASITNSVSPPMYVASGEPSGKATASLICGIFFFFLPAAIGAVVFGHLALAEIKRSGGRLIGGGRAVAGLVLGYIGLAGIPFILIIAAIAIPNLLRARIAANEASAVGSIRTLNTAEYTYSQSYPQVGFACSLTQLGGVTANANSMNAGLIDNRLMSSVKSGYRFQLGGCTVIDDKFATYTLSAEPIQQGTTGVRSFCSDQTGVIRTVEGYAQDCFDHGSPLQ